MEEYMSVELESEDDAEQLINYIMHAPSYYSSVLFSASKEYIGP